MGQRKISLVSLIEDRWIRDGSPALSWEDLMKRTLAADEELEKHGHTPLRLSEDIAKARIPIECIDISEGFTVTRFTPLISNPILAIKLGILIVISCQKSGRHSRKT